MKKPILCLFTVLLCASTFAQTPTPQPTLAPMPSVSQTPTAAPVDYIAQLRPTPTPTTLTPAMLTARRTVSQVPMLTGQLFRTIQTFATALWSDPTQAQAVVDSLGEKAAPLFVSYGTLIGPLSVIDPLTAAKLPPVPAGYQWTILPAQADGTWPVGQRSVLITFAAPAAPAATPTPAH